MKKLEFTFGYKEKKQRSAAEADLFKVVDEDVLSDDSEPKSLPQRKGHERYRSAVVVD